MIEFDPENLFPLVPEGVASYSEAQSHSALVDEWLGFAAQEIENNFEQVVPEQQLWMGLPLKTLLTPYTEIREILERLDIKAGSRIVDLGAGYGRMAFVIGVHYQGVQFIGYEYVAARVNEANRCLKLNRAGIKNREWLSMQVADLSASHFKPIAAEIYFLYDYGDHSQNRR